MDGEIDGDIDGDTEILLLGEGLGDMLIDLLMPKDGEMLGLPNDCDMPLLLPNRDNDLPKPPLGCLSDFVENISSFDGSCESLPIFMPRIDHISFQFSRPLSIIRCFGDG